MGLTMKLVLKEDSGVVLDSWTTSWLQSAWKFVRTSVLLYIHRRHFPRDVEPLTEWEGAKCAVSMVDILEGGGGDTVLATTNILEKWTVQQ